MSETRSHDRDHNPVLTGKFGKTSGLSLVFLSAGLLFAVLQVLVLTDPVKYAWFGERPYIPGVAGAVLLLFALYQILSKGNFQLYHDRIEGKKRFGGKFQVDLEPELEVNLNTTSLLLRNESQKLHFFQAAPQPQQVRGLIWLILQYPWIRENGIFHHLSETAPIPGITTGQVRDFIIEEQALFHDGGFRVEWEDLHLFFPYSDTYQLQGDLKGYNSIARSLRQKDVIIHFDPSPGELPLLELVSCVLTSSLDKDQKKEWLTALCEKHGGTLELTPAEAGDTWYGTTRDLPVVIRLAGN